MKTMFTTTTNNTMEDPYCLPHKKHNMVPHQKFNKLLWFQHRPKKHHQSVNVTLCTLSHTAYFKGCPALKSAFKKSASKIQLVKAADFNTQPRNKSYVESTNSQKMNIDQISNTFSTFITTLNSLISPLISLLFQF